MQPGLGPREMTTFSFLNKWSLNQTMHVPLFVAAGLVLIHADPLPPQHCSRIETVSSIAAFDGLSPCIPTTPEELDAALSLQVRLIDIDKYRYGCRYRYIIYRYGCVLNNM
jgi:hypothetical protein